MRRDAISIDKEGNRTENKAAPCQSCAAQDLMRPNPVFLHTRSTIQQAMDAFRKHRISSLLVADENPLDGSLRLVGRVCIKDALRLLFPGLLRKDLIVLNQVLHKPIDHILYRSQQTINPLSDIKKILSVMLGEFPQVTGVQQDGKLVGQINCTDLLGLFKPINRKDALLVQFIGPALPTMAKVSRAMAKHVLCLGPKDEISKAVGVFMAAAPLNIPILDEKGKLERILSQQDVLEYILELIESKELAVFEKKGLILDRNIGSLIEKEFETILDNDNLVDAVKKMIEKNVFCLAVTDNQQRFCGLLSFTEILSWLYDYLKKQAD